MGGLKTGPSRRHRIQPAEGPFLDPRAKETCFKKGSESGPLEIKSGPPWRVQFWSLFGPFNVANLLRRLFQVEADLTSNSCGWNLELGRPIFARLLFLTFLRSKKGPLKKKAGAQKWASPVQDSSRSCCWSNQLRLEINASTDLPH